MSATKSHEEMLQQGIEFIRGHVMSMSVHNKRLESLCGHTHLTLEMDALVGKMFRVLTDMESYKPPQPIPQKECEALRRSLKIVTDFTSNEEGK